jgi:single-stranded DNA-binding protein
MIDAAFFGVLGRDAEHRTSKAGREYLRLNVRVGYSDDVQWVSVRAFTDIAELADRLRKDARVYVEGTHSADAWLDRDGEASVNLNVMSWRCFETHRIGRNKPKGGGDDRTVAAPARPNGVGSLRDDLDDEIPFLRVGRTW